MMINKRLISMMGDSKRYIAWNVVLQFLALLANIVMIFAVSRLLAGLLDGTPDLPTALLYILGALIVRFFCTRGAASASYNASCTVKKTLRAAIYEKLLRLGGSYTQAVPTAEVLQLAGEGVEQLETYFGAYLPQFFYAMIAPVTLFIALAPVSLHAAVILMICVPLIPVSIVAVQKFAKKLLGKYWGRYAALGDSFLENLQGLTTLKIYQADEARHAAMNREAEHFRKVTMKVLTMQLNSIIVMDVIAYGGAALGIIVAAKEFAAGRVALSGALCIILLSADFFLPMRALGSYFHVAMNGMAASDNIFKLLDLPEGSARTAQLGSDCAIACRDLHFGYTAEKETLHGLNLDFPQGSFTALVHDLGIDTVISPKDVTASQISSYVRGLANSQGSAVESLHKILGGAMEAVEFTATGATHFLNTPLKDLNFKPGLLVAAIVHGGKLLIPGGHSIISEGDRVIVVAKSLFLKDLNDILVR